MTFKKSNLESGNSSSQLVENLRDVDQEFLSSLSPNVKQSVTQMLNNHGLPGGTRTLDHLLRRQMLYPAELLGAAYTI